jgi:hypothetical protein
MESYYGNIINGISKSMAAGHAFTAAELYITGCKYCTNFIPTVQQPKPPCLHRPNSYPGVRNTPKESEGFKTGWHYVLDTCQQYLDFYRNDHWIPLAVETVKQEIIYEDEDIRILWKGKIDWIVDTNQGIFPVDHKTMKQRRKTISLNNQFSGYCILMKTRSVMLNKIGFQSSLKPEEKFTRPPVSYSAERLLEWQGEILPHYAKLLVMYAETGYWPPNFEKCEGKYGNCAFLDVCDANPYDRDRVLKEQFMIGPEWNPTNEEPPESDSE